MTVKAYLLSDDDRDMLREWLHQQKNQRSNTPSRPGTQMSYVDGQEQQGPEVYLAKCPDDGIEEMTEGSGSSFPDSLDQPGSADCDIYRMIPVSGEQYLARVKDMTLTVFNASRSKLTGYVQIWRDKFGTWWAGTAMPPMKIIPVMCDWTCDGTTGESTKTIKYAKLPLESWEDDPPSGTDSDLLEPC